MLGSLAWRNLWRNKRRTFITAASIMFAVLFASTMKCLQKGAWGHMVNNVVNFYYGFGQIQANGYQDDQSLDMAFVLPKSIESLPDKIEGLTNVAPRVESFALASYEEKSTGVLLIGTDPIKEDAITGLSKRLKQGRYFEKNKDEVIIAQGLANVLNIQLLDTLVLISQGYHGSNAAGKYPVVGLVNFGSPELNKQMVYLPLKAAQWFYNTEGKITSAALHIEEEDKVSEVLKNIRAIPAMEEFSILDWKELVPDLLQAKALDEAGSTVVLGILYLIITFGIFGTILMMTKEREYEFGVLISIGMQRMKLAFTVWLELLFIGILGTIAGILISIPIIYYFQYNPIRFTGDMARAYENFGVEPILPTVMDFPILGVQAMFILIITTILALFPIYKISKLNPIKARMS